MSDLWRMTDSLHLFGDDEEEQNLLSRSNTKVAGLPLPTDQVTAEEQLMLYNGLDASYVAAPPSCRACEAIACSPPPRPKLTTPPACTCTAIVTGRRN